MYLAGSTIRLAEAGLDPGGIILGLLCLAAVAFTALMTRRAGGQHRRPAGTPIHRRSSPFGRQRRRIDDDFDGGDHGESGGSDGSGGGCGGGCGGGGT